MTANTLNADNATQKNQSKSFSIKYNNQWTTEDQVANASDENATFEMQLSGKLNALKQPRPGPASRSGGKNPASVARRNARERRRIKNVNSAFDELRQHVPHGDRNRKKISKVDTLQSAIEYIKALEDLVRSRRKSVLSSEEGQHTVEKLSKKPSDSNDFASPASPIFSKSESERSSFSQDHEQDEFEVKATSQKGISVDQRPSEITESMLKAFDIMLQQETLKRTSSLPKAILCKRSTPSEAISVEDEQTPSDCADNVHALSSDSRYVNVFQSSEPRNDQETSELHPIVLSPEAEILTPESESRLTEYSNYYDASVQDPSVGSEYALDIKNNSSNAGTQTSGSLVDAEMENWSPAHRESQVSAEWSSNAVEQWPVDVSHSNDVQNDSEFFDFQSSFIPTNIDQINPSIDFLPESDDFPHYNNTATSLPLMVELEQMTTSFANQPPETCWVLAQLN